MSLHDTVGLNPLVIGPGRIPARGRAFTSRNIKAGFAACGLFPFNPDRVLRDMPKPLAELTISKPDEVRVGPCRQDAVPQTPVTPVSVEALISLQDVIIKRDAYALDETRHLHKFVKAAQSSFAKGILQQNQIQFLMTINNEAKVRRSTKSVVLGKAKVMSYEDLKEARTKRAEKEAAKETKGKGKRGRKRKAAGPEAEAELTAKVARMSKALAPTRASVARMSETQVAEDGTALRPWRAPVARMW
jgi:hypothetical protein